MSVRMDHTIHLEEAVLELLAYYQIFKHPLRASELLERIALTGVSAEELNQVLQELAEAKIIFEEKGYYFLEKVPQIVQNREEGEQRAKKLMKVARFSARFIYTFPFVRAVFISGSLSKGTVPKDSDIDYFIITKKHRLWIARTLIVLFKKVFLLNSKKYFCTNYFIDEETLEIPDQNIFTATEITTLIPLRGNGQYARFMKANDWVEEFYPNIPPNPFSGTRKGIGKNISEKLVEPVFFHSIAEKLDKYFMRKTYRHWQSVYPDGYSDDEFELAFRSRRGTSKNHDKNYQKRVLKAIKENKAKAMNRTKLMLADG